MDAWAKESRRVAMDGSVVITGIGMVVPLGMSAPQVLRKIQQGISAKKATGFPAGMFDCPVCAGISNFDAELVFPDNKTLRLMNRDAQLAAVAAHMALNDAGIVVDETYAGEEIALFGATGVAGMTLDEAEAIVRHAADSNGNFDLQRFGAVALKRIRPVITFKILASMPICFVSIFQNIRGVNAIYSPWEGNGAQAIAAGIRTIRQGEASCALVGGCDVKTRELAFVNLQQLGIFEPWKQHGTGCIPGEGAVFLVLEDQQKAAARNKKPYARLNECRLYSASANISSKDLADRISSVHKSCGPVHLISACDGDGSMALKEQAALKACKLDALNTIAAKAAVGNLFAAAAFLQVGLAAALAQDPDCSAPILAHCSGYGSEQAIFFVEAA